MVALLKGENYTPCRLILLPIAHTKYWHARERWPPPSFPGTTGTGNETPSVLGGSNARLQVLCTPVSIKPHIMHWPWITFVPQPIYLGSKKVELGRNFFYCNWGIEVWFFKLSHLIFILSCLGSTWQPFLFIFFNFLFSDWGISFKTVLLLASIIPVICRFYFQLRPTCKS